MSAYKRVVLKISGEYLSDGNATFAHPRIDSLVKEIIAVKDLGTQLSIVIGGGNVFRGHTYNGRDSGFIRTDADKMGMLATAINAIALRSVLDTCGVDTTIMSSIGIEGIANRFSISDCDAALDSGKVVIFCCGTGNPFFSTDSAAALRACELHADILLKATNVDGIYDRDPHQFADAKKFTRLTYQEVLQNVIHVMDLTAFVLCMENAIPIRVFNGAEPGMIVKAASGSEIGTIIE